MANLTTTPKCLSWFSFTAEGKGLFCVIEPMSDLKPCRIRYSVGNASDYPGSDLVNDAQGGVVSVIIQYRLGLFGRFRFYMSGSNIDAMYKAFSRGKR